MHLLALDEIDRLQRAVDLAVNRNRVPSLHAAQCGEQDRHVALHGLSDGDRNRRRFRCGVGGYIDASPDRAGRNSSDGNARNPKPFVPRLSCAHLVTFLHPGRMWRCALQEIAVETISKLQSDFKIGGLAPRRRRPRGTEIAGRTLLRLPGTGSHFLRASQRPAPCTL